MSARDQIPDDAVPAVERSLLALRRSQGRRTLHRMTAGDGDDAPAEDAAVFRVLDAVEAAAEGGGVMTVNGVADALGVDQPRASRLVARAVDAGLVRRGADPRDGRRSILALTSQGSVLLARAHQARQDAVARTLANWRPEDRETFARLLSTFVSDWTRASRGAR